MVCSRCQCEHTVCRKCLEAGAFRYIQITSQINLVHAARCPLHGEVYVPCAYTDDGGPPDIHDLGSATEAQDVLPDAPPEHRTRERVAVTLALFIGFIAGVALALLTVAVVYRAHPPRCAPNSGVNAAMNPVAARYSRALHAFVLKHWNRPEQVDEVARETHARLMNMPEGTPNPLDKMYGIATDVIVSRHGGDRLAQDNDAQSVLPENLEARMEMTRRFDAGIQRLSPLEAAALLAEKRDGMPQADVAHRLGISEPLVQQYVTKAKAAIRTMAWRA